MAVLSYNGIHLPFCDVTTFSMEAVADDSNTDRMLTRFDIQVNCLVTADALDMIAPGLIGTGVTDPASIMALIQEALMQRRKKLSFQFNDFEFIPQPAGVRGFVDAANGPIPQSVTPIRIDELSWWVQYHIVANYVISYVSEVEKQFVGDVVMIGAPTEPTGRLRMTNRSGPPVISSRWEESVEIDEQQFTTRTRTGLMVIRSDNLEGVTADEMRTQFAVLSLPAGFVRKRASYVVDPSGLKLKYTVTDQEHYRLPPTGAYKATGEYTEHSTKIDTRRYATCRVTLMGRKGSDRSDLMRMALGICASKINIRVRNRLNLNPGQNGVRLIADLPNQIDGGPLLTPLRKVGTLQSAIATHSLYEPKVSLSITAWLPPATLGVNPFKQNTPSALYDSAHMNVTPLSPPDLKSPVSFDRGTAGILLETASYYDPTIKGTELGPQPVKKIIADDTPQDTTLVRTRYQHTGNKSIPGQAGVKGD